MTNYEQSPERPGKDQIGMQTDYLSVIQQQISSNLFEQGVVSRVIMRQSQRTGSLTNLDGLEQLEKRFIPSISKVIQGDTVEQELSLVAETSDDSRGRGFTYVPIGRIDATNTLYPYPQIDKNDADAVHEAANQLIQLRDDGVLPNLNYNLLSINNPYTGISYTPPKG